VPATSVVIDSIASPGLRGRWGAANTPTANTKKNRHRVRLRDNSRSVMHLAQVSPES